MRIGTGYDVHRLGPDRKLVIGGVEIPYELGLIGHSDADVLLHAIMDALLGAAALGDIGKHFPDTDERYRGISSIKLLQNVADLLGENHWIVENIDATIIAEKPKMRPFIEEMQRNIASVLGLELSQVNVKATTEEGLGFTGSGEGISAQAVCLLSAVEELCGDSVAVTDGRDCAGCPGCAAVSENVAAPDWPAAKKPKKDKAQKEKKKDSKKKNKTKDKKSKKAGSPK